MQVQKYKNKMEKVPNLPKSYKIFRNYLDVTGIRPITATSRKANALMESSKPVLHGERLMTDGELATALRVSPRALRDYRNEGILPYIRMKGNILYRESDVERVLRRCIRGKMTLQSG